MRFEMRRLNAALAVALCGFVLAGCSAMRDLAGLQKKSPDEFAVSTNGMRGNYSLSEKLLLANAGSQNSDPAVRARLGAEERARQNADRSFTDRILRTNATRDTGQPVNADAAFTTTTRSGRRTTATAAPNPEESGGWFDWF